MSLSTISVRRPVLTIVLNLLILLFGILGFKYLGVREYPSIDPPVITVRTTYAGANSDIIESQITEPLEKTINGIEGIRNISSSSNVGSSIISVEFDLGRDLETAANDVRDKVSQAVRQLPGDIDGPPVVSKADANASAIISMTLQSDSRSHLEISDYAENVITQRLQTIPGVSAVQIWGQKRYSMRLWLDPVKLSSFGITAVEVKQALDRENIELPSGKIAGDATELTVKTKGRFSTEQEFNDMIVKTVGDRIIRLRDVGYAVLGPENEESILRNSGVPMVGMAMIPQPGANYLDIANEFYIRFDQLKKELPADFSLNIALDTTRFIQQSVKEVGETLAIAITLVIIIIFLFFRDWSIALRPLIDIPVSLIGAFFVMYVMGFSINVLTLLAIVLATGLVVDDGIVVTENIYKKIEKGMAPIEAAIKGANEIIFAVISTSITLAVVFLPIIFMEGFVGRLFREFGIVIASSVLISSFVALTLTPMLNSKLIKLNHKPNKFYVKTEPFFVWLTEGYKNNLAGFLRAKWLAFPIIGLCIFLAAHFNKVLPKELAPLDDRSWLRISMTAPEGSSYEFMDDYILKITDLINDSIPEKRVNLTVTAPGFTGSGAVNSGFARLALVQPHERERSQQEIADYLGGLLRGYPEARSFIIQEQTISVGGVSRGGLPVQYVLQAPDMSAIEEKLPLFLEKANEDPTFIAVDVNLKFNKPELNITINREKARSLEVAVMDVAATLQLALSGQRFGYFTMNGKQYQIMGQFDRENRDEPLDLKNMFVRNNAGELIQMDNIVQIEEGSSPPQLYHYDRFMSATVSAGLAPGKTIGDGIEAMDRIAAEVLDERFSTTLTGASRDFAESTSSAGFTLLLALVLVYLVLAAQFESFIDPFIIMITVPLAFAGALLSLWYFNQTLNIFSQIGIIMLIGLVTKNGILMVEFANQLKRKGLNKSQAILDAATARLRPILMTSMATALGALPIAIAFGAASKSRMSMGIVVVGGIMFSLILTLFVIPAMYAYLSRENKPQHATPEAH
jgi:multidrug efflux pump